MAKKKTYTFLSTRFTAQKDGDRLIVILGGRASKRWGAHEARGVDTRDMGSFRRALVREIERLGRELGAETVDVYATMQGGDVWQVEEIDVD